MSQPPTDQRASNDEPDSHTRESGRGLSRRGLLFGGVTAGIGAAAGATAVALGTSTRDTAPTATASTVIGTSTEPFYGTHQAGVESVPQPHATFAALDLNVGTSRADLRRLMRVLSDDAASLTAGRAALADTEPELAAVPANLTVTFGFGPRFVDIAGHRPAWLAALPAFSIDKLDAAWSDGDLLIHIGADDPVTVAHALRMLLKDSRSFATPRWSQVGFRRTRGSEAAGTTMRNLFGQVDGTVNPVPGTADFASVVWVDDPESWMHDGTSLVIRRVHMDMDGWDKVDRLGRQTSMGRTVATGAPLTGGAERDEPDFSARDANGFTVIPAYAHIRRARGVDDGDVDASGLATHRIFRRGYNYDLPPISGGSVSNTGLIFASYQRDATAQFVPIQRRLDTLDLLNTWTTPIGSSVFAIPPGCARGSYIGDTLLD